MRNDTLGAHHSADLREQATRGVPKGIVEFVDRGR